MAEQQLDDRFPRDPVMLYSYVNTRLRDNYPEGLDQMCDDMHVDRKTLVDILASAGMEYIPEINQFR